MIVNKSLGGDVDTKPGAVKNFIEKNLVEFNEANAQKWRIERYWNEECDNIIKANITLFHQLYNTKGGLHKLPGEKIFMSIQEFITMLSEANLITDTFTDRDAAISFNLAKMTEIDEINYDKHMKLYFLEFLEALSRCADIMSLPPPNSHEEEWPMESRKEQTLAQKLENLLPILLKICKKEFIEKYKFPSRDPDSNLFIISNSPIPRSFSRVELFGTSSLIRESSKDKDSNPTPNPFKISRIE